MTTFAQHLPDSVDHTQPAAEPFPSFYLLGAVLLTLIFDFLFYDLKPGLSISLFLFSGLGVLALTRRFSLNPQRVLLLTLIAVSILQSTWEWNFSNGIVLSILLPALSGDIIYEKLPRTWIRFLESLFSLLKAPFQWFRWKKDFLPMSRTSSSVKRNIQYRLKISFWPLVLCILFFILLQNGNAILSQWRTQILETLADWLALWEFPTLNRIALWAAVFSFSFAFLHPTSPPRHRSIWFESPPQLMLDREMDDRQKQITLLLVLLNVLFLIVNSIDAFYLWLNGKLPQNVTHSQFVHDGVYNLIATVLLSAILLTWCFRKTHHSFFTPLLKQLGGIWILQNIFLVSSVLLRLKLYVDTFQLSMLRVGVFCFLLLVTLGFVLLGVYIHRNKSFRWLVAGNLMTTFTLFFVLQFWDIRAFTAHFNVSQWEKKPTLNLDINYMESLGPSAWPALLQLARNSDHPVMAKSAHTLLWKSWQKESEILKQCPWQSRQFHREYLVRYIQTRLQEAPL